MLSLVVSLSLFAVADAPAVYARAADAPVVEARAADAPAADARSADAPVSDSGSVAQLQLSPAAEPVGWEVQYSAGALAALVAVPASLYFADWLGSLSNSLIGAALPVLLSIGLIPPLAVTAATVLVGNWKTPGRYRWWPALLATTVVNGASLAIGASLGLSVGVVGRVIVYTLVQAVVQPGVAVGLERAWPRAQPTVITLRNEPVSATTFVVPTSTWSF